MIPYNVLNACDYNELYKNTKIFSIDQLESDLVIKLPKNCADLMIYELINISKSDTQEDVFIGEISREPGRLWLDVKLHLLDTTSGKHMYKLKFTDECNRKHMTVYFAYIIQDDNPITPYVYMPGRGNNPDIEPDPGPLPPVPKPVDYKIICSEPYVHMDENSDVVVYLTSLKDNQPFREHYTYTVTSVYNIIVEIRGNAVYIKGIRHGNCGIKFTGDFSQQTLKLNVEVHPVDYEVTVSTKRLEVPVGETGNFTVQTTSKGQPLEEGYKLLNSNPDCFSCEDDHGTINVTGHEVGTGVITVIGRITGPNYGKDVNIVISKPINTENDLGQ